jgi:hypothetical protein
MEMEDMKGGGPTNAQIFLHLVTMFQVAAMQQLGKVMNPVTNKIERDLEQAKFSIDIISMLKEKTKGNLSPAEEEYLGKIVFELQMNYVDEVDREKKEKQEFEEKEAAEPESDAVEAEADQPKPKEKTRKKRDESPKTSAKKGKGVKGSLKSKKKAESD